jgi:hypothetical protein
VSLSPRCWNGIQVADRRPIIVLLVTHLDQTFVAGLVLEVVEADTDQVHDHVVAGTGVLSLGTFLQP